MTFIERAARAVDGFQQRHAVLAYPFAVVKKYGDDQAGRLASLVAYYGFFSLFPLMLVFVSALGFVLAGHPDLRRSLVDSAFGGFQVIGPSLKSQGRVHALQGNWIGIAVGGATALWSGLAVAQAAEVAMNTVWDIPRSQWANFVFRRVRALGVLALLGTITVSTTFITSYTASGAAAWLPDLAGWAVAFVLNIVLFVVSYQILTSESLRWRNVVPGAVIAALLWTVLQAVGGFYLTHQLAKASAVYGTFALVLGLFVWIGLGAKIMLFCAEINVVWHRRLWPRRIVQPPINDGDKRVFAAIVGRARMRPEVSVSVWFTHDHEKGAGRTVVHTAERGGDDPPG
jgi:YihY family inner membrane protein